MENPFSPDFGPDISLKRNGYDLSRQGLFTTEIGQISPLLSMEVIPGDTVRIDSSQINIQGMPTLYPLQTRLRVSASFYYGRNRTVHEHFEDFIFNTKEIEAPWLRLNNERAKQMISTGSLGDMLGVPSTVGTDSSIQKSWLSVDDVLTLNIIPSYLESSAAFLGWCKDQLIAVRTLNNSLFISFPSSVPTASGTFMNHKYCTGQIVLTGSIKDVPSSTSVSFLSNVSTGTASYNSVVTIALVQNGVIYPNFFDVSLSFNNGLVQFGSSDSLLSLLNSIDLNNNDVRLMLCFFNRGSSSSSETPTCQLCFHMGGSTFAFKYINDSRLIVSSPSVPQSFPVSHVVDATDDDYISHNPFVGNNPALKISAYKFRLYEQICNYYYRNDKNNPYVLDNEVQYNEFIPTHADGADDNVYVFHYRNWELDRFTSCTQTPQFGEAPLVGLTYNPLKESAVLSFSGTDSEGTTQDYEVTVGIDEDGKLANIADFSKDIPVANLNKLQDLISYGISINDLRVTNSFQRFLENTLRRGLRYRNQLKSHFGTSVDYPDIDIPQYIGGFSGEFTVGRVESTADTEGAPLGDFTGKLFGQFVQQNPITIRIPEHGFIFCMFTISPIPQYPQSIDKSLLKTNYLDYFVPEFGKSLGHVPVEYAEVCPLQNYGVGENVHDIFGYQRAYYDYMQAFDEVHGDFRTNLKDFAMLRTFSERPELGEDFTTIHPEQVNDVFVVRNVASENHSSKHFLGNFYFHITVARPIPKVGTPSLE